MGKLNLTRERFEGLGFEIAKVVYMFSLVSEILLCGLAAYTGDQRFTPILLMLLLVPVYSVIIRRLFKNFFLFFLAHVLLIGLVFLLRDPVVMAVVGVYILADIIYIYVRKISGANDPMTVALLLVAFVTALVLYLTAESIGAAFVRPLIITMFILQVVIYLFYFHHMNMRETLSANTQSANQSIRKINSLNNKAILMFMAILLILIAAGVFLRLDVVITMIGQLLLFVLRFIGRLLFRGGSTTQETITPEESPTGGEMVSGVPDGYEPWKIWLILEKIGVVFCVIVAIALVIYVAYRLYQRFKMDRVEEDVLSDYSETTLFVERVKREKKERTSIFELFNLSNEKKVRRLFRKKVLHRMKAGDPIRPSQTAQEIRAAVRGEDLSRLTDLYEKARYSNEPVTKEEVQSVS